MQDSRQWQWQWECDCVALHVGRESRAIELQSRVQGVRQGLPVGSDIDGIARKGKVSMAIVGQATLFCPLSSPSFPLT